MGQQQASAVDHANVTTAFGIDGYRIARNIGLVRGITVRSRSVVGSIGAAFQQLGGGNISLYTELAEHAREEAYQLMLQHAAAFGANGGKRGALRRHRDEPGRHRGHLLRHGRGVRADPIGQREPPLR